MATPQGGYPQQDGFGQPGQQYPQEGYEVAGSQPAPETHTTAHGRKKRAYAGQAYEFGAGANSALGGQQQGGGQLGGYGQQPQTQLPQTPSYGTGGYGQAQPAVAPGFGQPDGGAAGGYQPPTATYPAAGVGQLNQQMGQMSMAERPIAQASPQRATQLNQLYPTDLLNTPLNVAELEYPPPPVILPPNVSEPGSDPWYPRLTGNRQA